jgi:hypothetical protein
LNPVHPKTPTFTASTNSLTHQIKQKITQKYPTNQYTRLKDLTKREMRDPAQPWVAATPPLQQNATAGVHEATAEIKGTKTPSIFLCFSLIRTFPFLFFNEWEKERDIHTN